MTPSPATRSDATSSVAAVLGGMLWALLAALFGVGRRGVVRVETYDGTYEGVMECVRRAEAEAAFGYEPWVEWEAVPAPWRNGQLLPRRHEARRLRRRAMRFDARMRGPPLGVLMSRPERTGMAFGGYARGMPHACFPVLSQSHPGPPQCGIGLANKG